MPDQPQIKSLQGLKDWGIQPDTWRQHQTDFRQAHPIVTGIGDFLTGGATDPESQMGPADLLVAASPLIGAGVAKMGEMALPGLKRAVLRPDAVEGMGTEAVGGRYGIGFDPETPRTRRQFLDKFANNDLRRAKRDLPNLIQKDHVFGETADNDPTVWHSDGNATFRKLYPEEKSVRKLLGQAEERVWGDQGGDASPLEDALGIGAMKDEIYNAANDAASTEGPILDALHNLMKRFGVK